MSEPIEPLPDIDVPARVIAVLTHSTVRVLQWPGVGMLDGGVPAELPIDLVPMELRMPNTEIILSIRDGEVARVAAKVAR